MSWLLDLLVDAVKEMVSQFIIDMMGLITDVFTDLLSCNLSLFEELFSVVGSLYQNVIVPMGEVALVTRARRRTEIHLQKKKVNYLILPVVLNRMYLVA